MSMLQEDGSNGGARQKKPWHLGFRLTINQNYQNADNLGDRDLAFWVGNQGVVAFATYSYSDLNGNGNPNIH